MTFKLIRFELGFKPPGSSQNFFHRNIPAMGCVVLRYIVFYPNRL